MEPDCFARQRPHPHPQGPHPQGPHPHPQGPHPQRGKLERGRLTQGLEPLSRSSLPALLGLVLLLLPACRFPWSAPSPTPSEPVPVWQPLSGGARWTRPQPLIQGERNEYPDLALTTDGTLWTTWIGYEGGPERVMLSALTSPNAWEPPSALSLPSPDSATGWPRVLALNQPAHPGQPHTLLVVWSQQLEGRFQVQLATLLNGELQSIAQLSSDEGDHLRPVLGLDHDGNPWVAWEHLTPEHSSITLRRISPLSVPVELVLGELNLRPTLEPAASGGIWIAWDGYDRGTYDLRLARVGGAGTQLEPIRTLTGDGYLHQAPSLATDAQGQLWVAWHSDRPSALAGKVPGPPRAGRALLLAQVRPEGLLEPLAGPPPTLPALKDWPDRDDCLEFPLLRFDGFSRPALFARRGQGFVGLVLEGERWLEPLDLSEPGWGGRGRELRAVLTPDGRFHLVARWLHKVGHAVLELPVPAEPERILELGAPVAELPGSLERLWPLPDPTLAGLPQVMPLEPGSLERETLNAQASPRRLAFGDLHTHTAVSDGTGDVDEVFTRSRDRLELDFVALTDHDVSNGNRYSPSEWAYALRMGDFFDRPGHFVTLQAYEWTSPPTSRGGAGHRNVYFPGDTGPLFGVDLEAPDTLTLFALLRSTGAFTIPHHTSWTGTDWEHFDPALQPLFEVVSVHGASERATGGQIGPRVGQGGTYAVDGLRAGLEFGFVGGSDGHGVPWHYGVSRQEDVWTTGLTGVWTEALDRASLHAALAAKHCFATSGPKLGIWLEVAGQPMGSRLSPRGAAVLHYAVEAGGPLRSVELVRDGETWRALPLALEGSRCQGQITLEGAQPAGAASSSGSARGDAAESAASADATHASFYLRVTRADGAMAWTSPVWMEAAGP